MENAPKRRAFTTPLAACERRLPQLLHDPTASASRKSGRFLRAGAPIAMSQPRPTQAHRRSPHKRCSSVVGARSVKTRKSCSSGDPGSSKRMSPIACLSCLHAAPYWLQTQQLPAGVLRSAAPGLGHCKEHTLFGAQQANVPEESGRGSGYTQTLILMPYTQRPGQRRPRPTKLETRQHHTDFSISNHRERAEGSKCCLRAISHTAT